MSLGKLGKINTKLSKFLKLPNHKPNHKRIPGVGWLDRLPHH